jgi:hypothetical protein
MTRGEMREKGSVGSVGSAELLPLHRDLYSKHPEMCTLEPWELQHGLCSLGYTEDLAPEGEIAAAAAVARTPAAQWDSEWAAELIHDALARLAERHVETSAGERDGLDLSGQEPFEERIHAAGLANDPAAFREALQGWERATTEALEVSRGAA